MKILYIACYLFDENPQRINGMTVYSCFVTCKHVGVMGKIFNSLLLWIKVMCIVVSCKYVGIMGKIFNSMLLWIKVKVHCPYQ